MKKRIANQILTAVFFITTTLNAWADPNPGGIPDVPGGDDASSCFYR